VTTEDAEAINGTVLGDNYVLVCVQADNTSGAGCEVSLLSVGLHGREVDVFYSNRHSLS